MDEGEAAGASRDDRRRSSPAGRPGSLGGEAVRQGQRQLHAARAPAHHRHLPTRFTRTQLIPTPLYALRLRLGRSRSLS